MLFIFVLFSYQIYGQTYLRKIETEEDFAFCSGLPLSGKYGQVSAVKLVYDLVAKRLYFVTSAYYKYHHEFCSQEIDSSIELELFNEVNYSNRKKRRYLLANLNYYRSLDVYAMELSPADQMSKENIVRLMEVVSNHFYIGKELHLLLNSNRLLQQKNEFSDLSLLEPSKIYCNLNYQAIGKYQKCGKLRFIYDFESEKENIEPEDIIVLDQTPLFLPKVSGVIVTEFQTPLSHLTILGQNRQIPIAAYKKAFQDSALLSLEGRNVSFSVRSDTLQIERIKHFQGDNSLSQRIKLKHNLEVDSLIGVEYITKKSYKYAGNKAANFGVLFQLSQKYDFKVPEAAFVIPFYFYEQHIHQSTAKILIDELINSSSLSSDSISFLLKNIRRTIKHYPIDKELLAAINQRVEKNKEFTRLRFRSSTNAEDAKGFSGAGLYTSKTGIFQNNKKSFERAIQKVWASLWSYEAFSEREYFQIKHRDVYMAILVHRSFPDEEVNGVAITKNLYRSNNYGFVVNAQKGEESVVQPKDGQICDQFVCYPNKANNVYKNKNSMDIITQSNLNAGKLVMTSDEIQHLANQLDRIKSYFYRYYFMSKSYMDFGLDIEFKLNGDQRELYIKQVRLYND